MRFITYTTAAAILVMVGGVAQADLQEIQDRLQSNYTPEGRPGGLRSVTGDEPFTGDCKDYYMAAMHQLIQHGYAPVAAIGKTRGTKVLHIMACAHEDGALWCLDNTSKSITLDRVARRQYRDLEFREYAP